MLGALIGDIVGSVFEWNPHKSKEFKLVAEHTRFTDDSVMTIAAADALLHGRDYLTVYKHWGRAYPHAGYGSKFKNWMQTDGSETQDSFGNGSAMRVSPVGWAFETLEEVLEEAKKSAEPSHGHPEGVKGACSVAAAIFLARHGKTKDEIKEYITKEFGYDLDRSLDKIRPDYKFDVTCQGSVPESIIAFLESDSFEDALRNAISLGGDADTQACIACSIAEAFYGPVDRSWVELLNVLLPQEVIRVIEEFDKKYLGSRYNFFCCGRERGEGKAVENGILNRLRGVNPERCRWWVKNPGLREEIWAFATSDKNDENIYVFFSTPDSVLFDVLRFETYEDAFIALNRNGFDLYKENYEYGRGTLDFYLDPPRRGFYVEPHSYFSSGKGWI